MRQTLVNIRSFFVLSFAQLPMLYSDSLLCFCSLLVFKHAEFLLRPIGLYPGNSCFSQEIFRAFPLRCARVYRHNDIIVLIIGKPNTAIIILCCGLLPSGIFQPFCCLGIVPESLGWESRIGLAHRYIILLHWCTSGCIVM